ncbi:hypothetical protein D3C81_2086240 [compost metagenome]
METRLDLRPSASLPSALGTIENVFEIPSKLCSYGNLATELKEASAPFLSRPCIGLAPGANGSPALRPSGVVPVFLP